MTRIRRLEGIRPRRAAGRQRWLGWRASGALLAAVAYLLLPAAALAITTISQDFSTKSGVALGSIVSLEKNSADQVSATTQSNLNSIIGVVITDNSSLLAITSTQANHVQVATSGIVETLVSDINGPIAQGDQITGSPIAGVGMKATSSAKVIGIAQVGLASGSGTSKQDYTDKAGKKHTILLGQVAVQVNVGYYYKQPEKTLIPSTVQSLANALAGKPVDSLPIIISTGIFLITLLVVVSIIYSMIHSSIISVGRNPMSQSAIYRDLVQMSALVVGILGVAVISIYMVLTKF